MSWDEFVNSVYYYRHIVDPTIDQLMSKFKKEKINVPSNNFHIPLELVQELKSIFKKSFLDHFMGYCSVKGLIAKLEASLNLEKYMKILVRPKGNL
jgi:hypothetical protein